MSAPKALFTPVQVGDKTLKNRITMSALTRNRAENTYPTHLIKEHYVQRASAGLLVSEATLVVRQGTEWPHAPGIWDAQHVLAWKNVTDAVHEAGGLIYSQLWHTGRVSHPEADQQKIAGTPVYGPSAVAARGGKFRAIPGQPGYVVPTPHPNPWELVQQFKEAAINAKKAGFDGVEVHAANGYIINQFIDSTANKRTDEWGGSIENRCRLALEVTKACVEIFGSNVAIKLSPCGGYNDVGMPLQETIDTYSYLVTELDKLGLAYICLVRYLPYTDSTYDGVLRATQHDVFGTYRPLIKNTKVMFNGAIKPDEAEDIAGGTADLVAIGLDFITHPDYAERVRHGKPLDNALDMAHMQTNKTSTDWRTGYNDYPAAVY
ncbi:FMN-linked oxidoreductase [Agrocybe pediades]|nr:FMN-linked oxidoreductase [Agrocybe pediades]